jgi:hypothetical protein
MGELTIEKILTAMLEPSKLTPRQVTEFYIYLGAIFAEKHVKHAETQIERSRVESVHVAEDMPHNQAKALAMASEAGEREIRLKAELTGIIEAMRALKKAQAFFSDEARNLL